MERVITITPESVRDVVAEDNAVEMEGDSIVRERVARVLTRDCARRKLLALLLPALDGEARMVLRGAVELWEDERLRMAALEVLEGSWP
jgi:hypothetical protein